MDRHDGHDPKVGALGSVGVALPSGVATVACSNTHLRRRRRRWRARPTRSPARWPSAASDFHSFPIAATGTVDVTLTAAAPPAAIVMGVSIGIPGDGKCAAIAGGSTQTPAGATVQLSGIASPGTLCVDVHDVGGQSAPVSYTVTVTHP